MTAAKKPLTTAEKKLIQIAENEPKVYEAGKADGIEQGIEQGMANVAHLNDELEQILYGTDTGGKSWLDTIYEDVTLTQDVTNVLQLYNILKSTIEEGQELVIFINSKWVSYPTAELPSNTILSMLIWSEKYIGSESSHLAIYERWRNNSFAAGNIVTKDYDATAKAGDIFRKVVLR